MRNCRCSHSKLGMYLCEHVMVMVDVDFMFECQVSHQEIVEKSERLLNTVSLESNMYIKYSPSFDLSSLTLI